MVEGKAEEQRGFVSKLPQGRERFLAHVVEHGLEIGQRTPDDFIRHFSPAAIMDGLRDQPMLRSQVLVLTTGVKQKIAMKKSAKSAGEDLQIALDEGETDAESIVALLNPDDRIRYLDHKRIWTYCIEGEFWSVGPNKKHEHERAKEHIAFMLDRALIDRLITHRDIVDGISVEELATRLPRSELGKLLKQALHNSHSKNAFTEIDLLTALPASEVVRHVPLPHIWETVVGPKIAQAHKYVDPPPAPATEGTAPAATIGTRLSDWPESNHRGLGRGLGGSGAVDRPLGRPLFGAVSATEQPAGDGEAEKETPVPPLPPADSEPPESVEVTDDDIRIS
ncbi:hypothetical protein ACFL5O_02295 [Myxococcota bacterium]